MKRLTLGLALAASLFTGCNARDFYSEVVDKCNQTYQGTVVFGEDVKKTGLTPDCKAALEAILPYDNDAFAKAPEGFKDKVTESFQALVAWPVKLPAKKTIFGVAPGVFPLWFLEEFNEWGSMNQSIFNGLLEMVGRIDYSADTLSSNHSAEFTIDYKNMGILKIADNFWSVNNVLAYNFNSPVIRAGTLVHEGWHGKGYYHTSPCPDGYDFECDADMNGPYGSTVVYDEGLLHGSAIRRADGAPPHLSLTDVMVLGTKICYALKGSGGKSGQEMTGKFQTVHPALAALLKDFNCNGTTAEWTISQEGLDYPVEKTGPNRQSLSNMAAMSGATVGKIEASLLIH